MEANTHLILLKYVLWSRLIISASIIQLNYMMGYNELLENFILKTLSDSLYINFRGRRLAVKYNQSTMTLILSRWYG